MKHMNYIMVYRNLYEFIYICIHLWNDPIYLILSMRLIFDSLSTWRFLKFPLLMTSRPAELDASDIHVLKRPLASIPYIWILTYDFFTCMIINSKLNHHDIMNSYKTSWSWIHIWHSWPMNSCMNSWIWRILCIQYWNHGYQHSR